MSITEKLNKIKSCKEDIKQAIIDKGVDMTGVSLEGYATKISEIQAGGGDYLDMRANLSTYYSTIQKIDEYIFAYCSSLQTVNLPMCSYVGLNAFHNCHSLQSVNLPICLSVSNYVFENCSSLTTVNLPTCEYVGNYAFTRCNTLQSIDLPMCSFIGMSVFVSCSSLQSVNLPICLSVASNAFASCSSISVLDLRSTYTCRLLNSNVFSKTPFASGVGSIYVHAAHLSQFQNATNWTYFSKCFVGVGDPTRPLLSFDNGRVYGDTYHLYSDNWQSYLGITSSSVISIDLPNYSYVGNYAFLRHSSLQTVNLPMCEYVGSSAFYYCSSLQSIDLPNCSYVGNQAFYYCSSLQSIDLPNCSYVGNQAFQSCSSLQSVNLPMCEYVGSDTFKTCSSLQSVNLPMCEYVGGSAFYDCNYTLDVYIGTSISKVCQAGGAQIFRQDWNTNKYLVNKIFVPMSLVDAYKSAQYWSDYASLIYGI